MSAFETFAILLLQAAKSVVFSLEAWLEVTHMSLLSFDSPEGSMFVLKPFTAQVSSAAATESIILYSGLITLCPEKVTRRILFYNSGK